MSRAGRCLVQFLQQRRVSHGVEVFGKSFAGGPWESISLILMCFSFYAGTSQRPRFGSRSLPIHVPQCGPAIGFRRYRSAATHEGRCGISCEGSDLPLHRLRRTSSGSVFLDPPGTRAPVVPPNRNDTARLEAQIYQLLLPFANCLYSVHPCMEEVTHLHPLKRRRAR